VITNGTAVLGLGNIGPLAGKPVMEGKAVLFKKFADLDAFDIEVNEGDPKKVGWRGVVCGWVCLPLRVFWTGLNWRWPR
jgi:malic enzyme